MKFKDRIDNLSAKAHDNAENLIGIVLFFLIILSFKFLPQVKFSFNFDSFMSNNHNQSYKSDKITLAVATKDGSALSVKDLCILRNRVQYFEAKNFISHMESAFDLSIPYNEGSKLLFRPLIDLDCKNYLNLNKELFAIEKISSFSFLTNTNKSDILISFQTKDFTKAYDLIKEEFKDFNFYISGPAVINYYVNEIIKSDWKVNVLILLIFTILFYLLLKSFKYALIYCGSIIISSLFILCLIPLFQISVNPLSASIFIIILIASIEDFIFLINDFKVSKDIKISVKKFIVPSFYTSLTTIIGFGSLALSEIRDIQIFGILTSIAALCEWIVIFFLVPGIIAKIKINPNLNEFSFLQKINQIRPKKILFYFSLLPLIYSFYSLDKLNADDNAQNIFFDGHPYHTNTNYFFSTRGFKREVLIQYNPVEKLNIAQIPGIESVLTYDSTLEDLTKNLNTESKIYLEDAISSSKIYESFHTKDGKKQVARIRTKDSNLNSTKEISKTILDSCTTAQECELFGHSALFAKYSDQILMTLYKSFATSFILIALFLSILSFYKLKRISFAILFSSLWGPLVMIGVFNFFNIPLNFMSCIFFSVYLGLAGDNGIQYLCHSKNFETKALEVLGVSSLYITLFTTLGSLGIIISGFKFTSQLGLYFALGFILNFIGDYYLLKSLNGPESTRP